MIDRLSSIMYASRVHSKHYINNVHPSLLTISQLQAKVRCSIQSPNNSDFQQNLRSTLANSGQSWITLSPIPASIIDMIELHALVWNFEWDWWLASNWWRGHPSFDKSHIAGGQMTMGRMRRLHINICHIHAVTLRTRRGLGQKKTEKKRRGAPIGITH